MTGLLYRTVLTGVISNSYDGGYYIVQFCRGLISYSSDGAISYNSERAISYSSDGGYIVQF